VAIDTSVLAQASAADLASGQRAASRAAWAPTGLIVWSFILGPAMALVAIRLRVVPDAGYEAVIHRRAAPP
jgi:hypothetical protein